MESVNKKDLTKTLKKKVVVFKKDGFKTNYKVIV
jgi:hypothetical protein